MTQQEIKQKIENIEKAIKALKNQNGSPDQLKKLEDGLDKYKSMLEDEKKPEAKPSKKSKSKSKMVKAKAKSKSKPKPEPKPESKPEPKKKVNITQKAIETQVEQKPIKKTLIIKKKEKEEKHIIDTSFGKDIEGAILSLNKARFIVREQKNRKTGKIETVKHSQEYRNSRAIQNKVDRMFNSSISDIAEKDKTKKKEIESLAKELRDIHVLWLNEIDIIISNGEIDDMKNIKKMLIGLLKEARKNDEDNKWRNAAGLETLAKKYL